MVPEIGDRWDDSSLLWQGRGGRGMDWEQHSPLDQSPVQTVSLLDRTELEALAALDAPAPTISQNEFDRFCRRLHDSLLCLAPALEDAMLRETAFVRPDCREMLDGSLLFVRDFLSSVQEGSTISPSSLDYEAESGRRQIHLVSSPWGKVAVILPQNAFLLVALTCLLNALYTGNRVVLRAPQQSARSAALLATVIEAAQPPPGMVSVVLTRAKDFVDALCNSESSCLLHYMGSSAHAPSILAQTFQSRKGAIIDGQGNGWVYVAEDACLDTAVSVLTRGAIRYNGQTCTSVNGAIIAPAIYPLLRDRLRDSWNQLRVGNPLTEDVDVGPLLDERQAQSCLDLIEASGGEVLCGGERAGNLLAPTLLEMPAPQSELATHGFFACALWITPGTEEDFATAWRLNHYPLCAGVISASAEPHHWHSRLSNLSRLTLNGDPSAEYLFAPWGGYPASGSNPVSQWSNKYQRIVQIDEPRWGDGRCQGAR